MDVQAQIRFPGLSGLPEDVYINTLYFDGLTPLASDYTDIQAAIVDFYNANGASSGRSLTAMLSGEVNRAVGTELRIYDIDAPGSPLYSAGFNINAAGSAVRMPPECAICLSFHSDLTGVAEEVAGGPAGPTGDTHPAARRRGRIFLGPLNESVLTTNTGHIDSGAVEACKEAMVRLQANAGLAIKGIDWCVNSRVDSITREVTGGWVDNAFDTQRRRGKAPTTRDSWGTGGG